MNREVRLESKVFLWAVVQIAVAFPFSPPWTEDLVGLTYNLGTWDWVLASSLGTHKKLWTVMALDWQSLERPRCCIQWRSSKRFLGKGKEFQEEAQGLQETKRPRGEGITHPRVEALVRGYRWEGRGSLQGTPLCTGGPHAVVRL